MTSDRELCEKTANVAVVAVTATQRASTVASENNELAKEELATALRLAGRIKAKGNDEQQEEAHVFTAESEPLAKALASNCKGDSTAAVFLSMKSCPLRTYESGTKKGLNVKNRIVAVDQQERVGSFGQELGY